MAGRVDVETDDVVRSEIFGGLEAGGLITYTVEYAKYVEFPTSYSGTQPPFAPLREWVGRKWPDLSSGMKRAAQREDSNGNLRPPSDSDAHKDAVAWLVVNAIATNGTDGVFFGKRALEAGRNAGPGIAGRYEGSGDPNASEKIVQDVLDLMFAESQRIISDEAVDTGNLLQSGSVELVDDVDDLPTPDE